MATITPAQGPAPVGEPEYKKHPGARFLHGPHKTIGGVEAWVIWGLCTVFVVWLFSIQTGYAVVSPEIQKTASLTVAQIGLAGSIYTWAFALCQFFSGALLDRFGSRPLLAIGVAFVTAGAFLYAQTTSMGTLIAAQIVLAVGSSFGFVGAGYIGGQWFPAARYGLMFGLVQSLASLGSAFGQPAISWQLQHVGWQQLLNGFGAMGVALIVLFALLVRNPSTGSDASEQLARTTGTAARPSLVSSIFHDLGACFRNRNVVLSSLLAGVSFGSMLAMGVLWGPRVMESRGAGTSLAAVLTAMSWLGLAVGAPLFNLLSDHWNNRRVPAIVGVLLQAAAVCLLIYLPKETNAVSVVTMFCVGLFAGAHMLGFTVAGESVPGKLVGSSAAIVNGVCFIIGGLLQAVPSKILPDSPMLSDYGHALLMMPILLVLGALAGFFIKETATPAS
ncbi:MFS transporter [Streptomyces sp. NPDC090306]|uniref:MFS transporter n=1 Tax=Streptomyces sp. NPDC090306 TaxID=3365961 RepID=UPI0037FA5F75